MGKTRIEWATDSWNPIRARWIAPTNDGGGVERVGWHCEHVSEGCRNCYAEGINRRIGTQLEFKPDNRRREVTIPPRGGPGSTREWRGEATVFLDEKMLLAPLRWRRPRRIFVCSMTDLFADFVPDAMLDRVFAVMALCPHHTFQLLTKRPERMREYVCDPASPHRVAKEIDAIQVQQEIDAMGAEEVRPIADFPGYFVTDRGRILSSSGSGLCLYCGGPVEGIATKTYCSQKCRQNACYVRRTGRSVDHEKTMAAMSPDVGEKGHHRVTLYRDGEPTREFVHRLVLAVFVRPPEEGEQGCHRNGNPGVNALPNLRWSDQAGNWTDSKRHGSARRHHKLNAMQVAEIRNTFGDATAEALAARLSISSTQVRNIRAGRQWIDETPIAWPLPGVWLGTSCEDQATADARIPELLATPAAIRFVSAEPLLGPVHLGYLGWPGGPTRKRTGHNALLGCRYDEGEVVERIPRLDWVIAGGESGPRARPMHPGWAQSLRDQCGVSGIAFLHKQNGAFEVAIDRDRDDADWRRDYKFEFADGGRYRWLNLSGGRGFHGESFLVMRRVGKKAGGRLLDGVTHDGFPEVRHG